MTSRGPLGGAGPMRRSLPVYAGVMALGVITLLVVTALGRGVPTAPALPRQLAVNAVSVPCLGARLAVVQSGVLIELGSPGDGADQFGALVATGRAGRPAGHQADLQATGSCVRGTSFGGQPFRARVQITGSGATGQLLVGIGPPIDLRLTGAAAGAGRVHDLPTAEVAVGVLLAVAALLAVTRLVGWAFARIHQPRVLGEIVAGVMLGPSLLGAALPPVTRYLFPGQVTDVLEVVAQVGLILFTFLIGLSVDLGQVRRLGRGAVLISHASIVVPFALGLLIALVLYPVLGAGRFAGFALFMGAAMAITAFPVLARILTETGIAGTTLGALAIACAAFDDVTAWCVLAVVVAVVKSSGAAHVVQVIGLSAVVAAVLVMVVGPALHRWLPSVPTPDPRRRGDLPVVAVMVALALLAARATDLIGTHAIFGASPWAWWCRAHPGSSHRSRPGSSRSRLSSCSRSSSPRLDCRPGSGC